jgi:hypothetical protein
MWVDEAIWGHRLHDEQTPWLAFLEFLTVLLSEVHSGRAFREERPNTLSYHPQHRLHLRNIVFNNPRLLSLIKDIPDNTTRWARWIEIMRSTAAGLGDQPDFEYLRERFVSFEAFARVVQLLRSTAIEGESNKRWSSKFVFPYGPAALYEDLNVRTAASGTNDRRFFGRVGELVYLMLCRSGRGEALLESLTRLVLSEDTAWNRLVRALSPDGEPTSAPRGNAYLPYAILPDFAQFADDWLALLRCAIPGYDVLPHLVDLLGLHILLYKLRRARDWTAPEKPVELVLEIIAPRRTTVRELAAESYLENNRLSRETLEAYLAALRESTEWQAALLARDPFDAAFNVLRQKVYWPETPEDYNGPETPEGLLAALREAAVRRHEGHVANVHARYARAIGLASRRGTRRVRYAPNDHLLKSIVFTVVPRRMEFQRFLEVLRTRYGFVIGHRQAVVYLERGQSDQKAFEDNAERLEMRLASLGLLRRLSDACAYVENPYAATEPS